MTDDRLIIPKVEFYITNVCNLDCPQCNRFNDYNFKGNQRWADYQSAYELWAQKIHIEHIVILGGEPLLNPDILNWIKGINNIWNNTVQILTNGTRLNAVKGLYETLSSYTRHDGWRNWVGISLHNSNDVDWYFNEVRNFLQGKITSTISTGKPGHNTYSFTDEYGMKVVLFESDTFSKAAVHRNSSGQMTLHNNDPLAAHQICGFAQFKNYHFIRGKLYKCGPVALFPEFDKQFDLELSAADRDLVNSYQALSAEDFDHNGAQFMANIDNPIPQCKFCSVGNHSTVEKIFVVRPK